MLLVSPCLLFCSVFGVDSDEAFCPDDAWFKWWDVMETMYFDITTEIHDLGDHHLLFWTAAAAAAALRLPLIRLGGGSAPLVRCLMWGGGLALTFLLLTSGGSSSTSGSGGSGLAEACLTFLLFIFGVWSVILSAEACPSLMHHRCVYTWSRDVCVILSLVPPRGVGRRGPLGG